MHEPPLENNVPRPGILVRAVATGLGIGYVPWASGTFGTLLGAAVLLIPGAHAPLMLWGLTLLGFAAGVPTSRIMARFEGARLNPLAARTKAMFQPDSHAEPDPSIVVIDEIVGIWITMLYVPFSLTTLLVGFFFFRLFDVVKPPPAADAERLPRGWGIMLDDVVAAVYANFATQLVAYALAISHLL